MMYLEFTVSETMEHFLAAHANAFAFFGGVPARCMVDNLKSAVLQRAVGETPVLNPRYKDFADHFGFAITPCGVGQAHEKGRVENAVGYVKKNFLAGLEPSDFGQLNPAARQWMETVANVRLHGSTKQRPVDLFDAERPALRPLPPRPYDLGVILAARASSQFRVRVDTNTYSVPAEYASAALTLKLYPDCLCVYHQDKLIARHVRRYGRHQDFEDPDHPRVLLQQRRKASDQKLLQRLLALTPKAQAFYEAMEPAVREVFDALVAHRGYAAFSTPGRTLNCDFYVPGLRLLIEYDEDQHFTEPRAIALRTYRNDATLHFERERWIRTCERVRAKDPTPPYRDEQRAFYDTLRDLYAAQHGFTLIRVQHGDCDWSSADAEDHLNQILPPDISPRQGRKDEMEFSITEREDRIVQSYLRRNPNHWRWEELVRDVLGNADPASIATIGERVRNLFGKSSRQEDYKFSPSQVLHLVTFIRFEDGLLRSIPASEASAGSCVTPSGPAAQGQASPAMPVENVPALSATDRATVQGYLRRNWNSWEWEHLVRDVLGNTDKQIIQSVGGQVRSGWSWVKGRLKAGGDLSDAEITTLIAFIRGGDSTTGSRLAPATPSPLDQATADDSAVASSDSSSADRAIVRTYLSRAWNRWEWEHLVADLLVGADRQIVNIIGAKVRQGFAWVRNAGLLDDTAIDRLVSFIRTEAGKSGQPRTAQTAPALTAAAQLEVLPVTNEMIKHLHAEPPMAKVALVSHDYNLSDTAGQWDYSEHFNRINRICDEQGCDTVLYALYTWDIRSTVPRNQADMFGGLKNVRRILIEAGNLSSHGDEPSLDDLALEIWLRDHERPVTVRQKFATSQEAPSAAQSLMDELSARRIGNALLMICGETNLASLSRASGNVYESYGFNQQTAESGVSVILNPIHDYMRRYEMKEKRRYYSSGGRTVVSVWNKGKDREADLPWTVFHDGVERTGDVRELPRPFADRPDIRIGIVTIPALAAAR